tara:strand:- start:1272 stop:2003 length:732 start_codon:yes stop_codon:yes gene_type:complete
MPQLHLSDLPDVRNYADNSNAILKIASVPTTLEVHFPAFLTDFSQNFDATWNTEDVFGRMDPIATYQGTKRTMSLGFDVPSINREEARKNLAKCGRLVQMVYPVYNNIAGAQILSKSPLVRIEFANLISSKANTPQPPEGTAQQTPQKPQVSQRKDQSNPSSPLTLEEKPEQTKEKGVVKSNGLLGWISGLSWKPVLEMGMFTGNNELLPKVISISFSFNILHEEILNQNNEAINNWPFGVKI